MRRLVVFHSLTGTTRKVAEQSARTVGATLVEVRAPRYRPRPLGFLRAAFDSWLGRMPPIETDGPGPEDFDYVLVLGPIWAGHASTPIRAWLARNRGKLKRAAFVLTCSGNCPPRALDEMATLSGTKPEAALTVLERDVANDSPLPPALLALLASIRAERAA